MSSSSRICRFQGENQIFGFGAKFEFGRKFQEPTPISPDTGRNRKIRDDEDTDSTFVYTMQKTLKIKIF